MSENWRRKKYYDKRVIIETEYVITPRFNPILVCLNGSELEMLRNITQYLHRRSTFAENYSTAGYLAPTEAEWDTIEALVATLEDKLMSECLDDLITAIDSLTSVQSLMMTCICQLSEWQESLAARLPDLGPYVTNGDVTYESAASTEHAPVEPGDDEEKCEFAQAVFYSVYHLYTETLLPFAQETSDVLCAAIIASGGFSLLGGWLGIPVAVLAAIISVLVGWGVNGSIENFTNWLWENKDELVCILYNNLPDMDAASIEIKAYIDDAEAITYLDKALLKTVLASVWHYSWIIADQEANGTWDASFIEGQCDLCFLDEQCAVLDCESENWGDIPPGSLGCTSGAPYALSAFPIRWLGGSPTQPWSGFKLQVNWKAQGDSGSAILGCDLKSDDTEYQIAVTPPASQPVGETVTSEWELSSPGTIGEGLDLRLAQATWFGLVNWYCIRPL